MSATKSEVLNLAPGASVCGQVITLVRPEPVYAFRDDLSCGPILETNDLAQFWNSRDEYWQIPEADRTDKRVDRLQDALSHTQVRIWTGFDPCSQLMLCWWVSMLEQVHDKFVVEVVDGSERREPKRFSIGANFRHLLYGLIDVGGFGACRTFTV